MNMEKLSNDIEKISEHSSNCTGVCRMVEEVHREGLASVFRVECDKCNEKFLCESSTKVKGSSGKKKRYAVNVGAVWGQVATGGGPSHLNEITAAMDIPGMHTKTFVGIEKQIGQAWETLLAEEMKKAGEEERQMAIQKDDMFEGVPAITVTVDAGWSKRSHKHSYNAMSGVAVIIGNATKKLLFLTVRNKYCSVCAVAENKGVPPKQHKCYKNWDGSSSAMESDMIVEGFRAAETMHGVRYMRMVGDGDSSVHANIQTNVSGWGRHVAKIECANHSVKCYRNRLEKIVQDFPKYKGRGKLTQSAIKRLTNGARCAIKINAKDGNVDQLRKDLRNGPNHVFNDHSNCSTYFCKVAAAHCTESEMSSTAPLQSGSTQTSSQPSPTTRSPPIPSSAPPQSGSSQPSPTTQSPPILSSAPPQLGSTQISFQPSPTSQSPPLAPPNSSQVYPNNPQANTQSHSSDSQSHLSTPDSLLGTVDQIIDSERELYNAEEEAREGDDSTNLVELPDDLYFRIQRAGDRLVSNAASLINNSTSNLAECFMGIRCKFDGGKVFNRIQRGSFQHRCHGAGLRFQLGPQWASEAWKHVTGEDPGEVTRQHYEDKVETHNKSMKRKNSTSYKEKRKKAR